MSKDKQRLVDYLSHILEAIERINRYCGQMTKESFLDNELIQDAVVRNLEIIGEASRNIERHHQEFALAHADIPLAVAYQMRNAIAHGYFKIDWEIVWTTIQKDLPRFHALIQAARAEQA